ncbi:MAG: hypothetical protein ABI068_02250 [Ktedonobacterales bacterium]
MGAYRRDDWATDELAALTRHLSICAECRQTEATYRRVGESLRQLPSITPPPGFKEALFARINAEVAPTAQTAQTAKSPAARARHLSRADTAPAIPVVRAPIAQPQRRTGGVIALSSGRPALGPTARVALALAAMLILAAFLARYIPGVSAFGATAANIFSGASKAQPHDLPVSRYTPDARYPLVTAAIASTSLLVYSAADATGARMVFAEDRHTRHSQPLLASAITQPVTFYALTAHWLLWSVGDVTGAASPWALRVTQLAALSGAGDDKFVRATHTLTEGDAASGATDATASALPARLYGAWSDDGSALVAEMTRAGQGEIVRYPLTATAITAPQGTLVAQASAPGRALMDPSADQGQYYWSEVWVDSNGVVRSVVWRSDSAGHLAQALPGDQAFHPQAAHGTLIWVTESSQVVTNATTTVLDAATLSSLTGSLQARDLHDGKQWTLATNVSEQTLDVAGSLVLWQANTQESAYDLHQHAALNIASAARNATAASVTDSAITWASADHGSIYIYDAA